MSESLIDCEVCAGVGYMDDNRACSVCMGKGNHPKVAEPPIHASLIEKLEFHRDEPRHADPLNRAVYTMAINEAIAIARQHEDEQNMGVVVPSGILSREEDRPKPCPTPANLSACAHTQSDNTEADQPSGYSEKRCDCPKAPGGITPVEFKGKVPYCCKCGGACIPGIQREMRLDADPARLKALEENLESMIQTNAALVKRLQEPVSVSLSDVSHNDGFIRMVRNHDSSYASLVDIAKAALDAAGVKYVE